MREVKDLGKWWRRFLELTLVIASWSKDCSTKCGAVIVDRDNRIISCGFNGEPKGTKHISDDREIKNLRAQHSERNALAFARQDVTGMTLFCNKLCCAGCAGAIINSGISTVVVMKPKEEGDFEGRWKLSTDEGIKMLKESGVEYFVYRGEL